MHLVLRAGLRASALLTLIVAPPAAAAYAQAAPTAPPLGENLRAQVLQARREGRPVDEMKKTITMPAYREWVNYEAWLPPSIENMNAYLQRIGVK